MVNWSVSKGCNRQPSHGKYITVCVPYNCWDLHMWCFANFQKDPLGQKDCKLHFILGSHYCSGHLKGMYPACPLDIRNMRMSPKSVFKYHSFKISEIIALTVKCMAGKSLVNLRTNDYDLFSDSQLTLKFTSYHQVIYTDIYGI